jgi:hypothetical protein
MDAKQILLKETFENEFDMERFERWTKEFFNKVRIIAPYKKNINYLSEFAFYIATHSLVADFTDVDRNKIAVYAVELRRGRSVEKARSMQRNFVSKLISGNVQYDAAIVAFYSEDEPRWRLSLVRLDKEFLAGGKVKTSITPAKRFSYLVGKGEPSRTAMDQLFPIFQREDFNPTLDKIEDAFSVETVTKEFFDRYREEFYDLKAILEKNEQFIDEATTHGFTSEQFAKKLMGQLTFLYFLQKKGWLGVKVVPHKINEKQYQKAYYTNKASRDIIPKIYKQTNSDEYRLHISLLVSDQFTNSEADVLAGCFVADSWNNGNKKFIRHIFEDCLKQGKCFFNDYLEPFFYEALRVNRGKNHYYKRFNCKIPFLNGGLFDPIENYEWDRVRFDIPNELFSNRHIKGDRDADGILDIFERYNFTMNEDEPLEREVAVDPEMLGKIFENLLDAKDRKNKGAFYTPREIVHYMCQESLCNYLVNEVKLPYDEVKDFILFGEIRKDEDCSKNVDLDDDSKRSLPHNIYVNLSNIDNALVNIKVADPAVGSGAFPLGMLSEIVKLRNIITEYRVHQIPADKKFERKIEYHNRNQYKIKWDTIRNSIFAVDIESSAVDIAKLRLWLSLVVDQEVNTDTTDPFFANDDKDPHPLPNLDYNIMCGNSLIDEFEGIKLFDVDKITTGKKSDSKDVGRQTSLFNEQMEVLTKRLFAEQEKFFAENDSARKDDVKVNINHTIDAIIRAKLSSGNNEAGLAKYDASLKEKTKPYFLWELEFAKVFKEKGGFDVVIGNPPYGAKFTKKEKLILASKYSTVPDYESADYFVDKGRELLKKEGIISYIIPNMFLSNVFATKYRITLLNSWNFIGIDNLSSIDVFDSAKVRNCIIFFRKEIEDFEVSTTKLTIIKGKINTIKSKKISKSKLNEVIDNWLNLLEQSEQQIDIIKKILENSTELGKLAEISQGLIPYDKYRGHSEETIKNRIWHSNNQIDDTYRRELAGKDVDRYLVSWNRKTWISYGNWLAAPRKSDFFTCERIIVREITNPRILAAYTKEEFYNTPSIINCINFKVDIKFILGTINSKLLSFYHRMNSPKANKGLFPKILVNDIRKLPINTTNYRIQSQVALFVDDILNKKKSDPTTDTSAIEAEIDKMVYELYNLTDEEIKIVEGV